MFQLLVSAFLVREGADPGPRSPERPKATKSRPSPACQRAIMQALRVAGANDVLAIKRNQPDLHAKVRTAFEDADLGVFTPAVQDGCEIVERNGGRRELRTGTVWAAPASASGWRTPRRGPACTGVFASKSMGINPC